MRAWQPCEKDKSAIAFPAILSKEVLAKENALVFLLILFHCILSSLIAAGQQYKLGLTQVHMFEQLIKYTTVHITRNYQQILNLLIRNL